LEKPEEVGQEEEEQEAELTALEVISVTDPEVVSLVIQILFWESTAIPVGEEKYGDPEKVVQEEEQEVLVDGISVTELPLLLVTQTL